MFKVREIKMYRGKKLKTIEQKRKSQVKGKMSEVLKHPSLVSEYQLNFTEYKVFFFFL